jgi:hypothetical protein
MKVAYLSVIFVFAATGLRAAGYCSLTVKVESPSGKAVDVRVVIEEENGWKTEGMTKLGVAEFCGLGIRPVSVTVGPAGCSQVVVRKVPIDWNQPRRISVLYDQGSCNVDTPPVAACALLLRFIDSNRVPINTATLSELKPFARSHSADDYGRILVRIADGQELSGEVLAKGYKPVQISIPCTTLNQRLEQMVVLERFGQ